MIGVSLGLLLGRSERAMEYAGPLLVFLRSIPPPALVPVFLLLFKTGTSMQLATIVFGVIWPVLLNSVDGARSVDVTKVDTSAVFQIPRWQWVLGVVLPAASPKIFAGLRVSLSLVAGADGDLRARGHGQRHRLATHAGTARVRLHAHVGRASSCWACSATDSTPRLLRGGTQGVGVATEEQG